MEWNAHLLSMIPFTAMVAATGRVMLAWLPPGSIGSHRLPEIGPTLAVSGVLGATLSILIGTWSLHASFEFTAIGWWLLIGVPLAVRLATAPGALVPRHQPAREAGGRTAQVLTLAIVGVVLWRAVDGAGVRFLFEGGSRARWDNQELIARSLTFGIASLAVAPIAVEMGLRTARRAPVERRLVVLAVAITTPFLLSLDATHARNTFVVGAASSVAWWRRADRRGLAIAAISFGGCAIAYASALLAIAGGVALVLFTARASRRRALSWSSACTLALGAVLAFSSASQGPRTFVLDELHREALIASAVALLAAITLALRGQIGRNPEAVSASGVDEPRTSVAGVGTALALGAIGLAVASGQGWLGTDGHVAWMRPALILAPTAWLWIGLVVTRAEQPPGSMERR